MNNEGNNTRRPIMIPVMELLKKNVGMPISATEIAGELGFTAKQVQNAITGMRNRSTVLNDEIEVLLSGNLWRWRPTPVAPVAAHPPVPTISASVESLAEPYEASDRATSGARRPTPKKPDRVAAQSIERGQLFEQVGQHDDHLLLVDTEGRYYRAYRI